MSDEASAAAVTSMAASPDPVLMSEGSKREWVAAGVGSGLLSILALGCELGSAIFSGGDVDRALKTKDPYGGGTFESLGRQLSSIARWAPLVALFFVLTCMVVWVNRRNHIRSIQTGSQRFAIRGKAVCLLGLVFAYVWGHPGVMGTVGYILCMLGGAFGAIAYEKRRENALYEVKDGVVVRRA
jgi:hypothetical protein